MGMETITTLATGLRTAFQADLDGVEQKKAEVMDRIAKVEAIPTEAETFAKAEYDRGFNDGLAQAGQANGPDKVFSNEEMEAELAPLKAEIEALKAENQSLKDVTDVAVNDAVAAKEAEMKAMFHQKLSAVKVDDEALLAEFAPQVERAQEATV